MGSWQGYGDSAWRQALEQTPSWHPVGHVIMGSRGHGGGHVVMQGSCDMGLWWGYGVIMGSLWGDGDSIWRHAWGVTPSWRPVGHVVLGVKGHGVKGGVLGSVEIGRAHV